MNILLMSDLEGVAGVLNKHEWVLPGTPYYDKAKRLLTLEVNAACNGFFRGGAKKITVCDGHGPGGIDPELLHKEAGLMRGFPGGFPFGLCKELDGVAWVGQHAKSNTAYAHLAHTQNHKVKEYTLNDISVGEMGQLAFCAYTLNVKPFFLAGDKAATQEAKSLFPNIHTVWVKEGLDPLGSKELSYEEYDHANVNAYHLSPLKARELIQENAYQAMRSFNKKPLETTFALQAPYVKKVAYRKTKDSKPYCIETKPHQNVWDALNDPGTHQ